jgi:hypothetical protein
VIDLDDPTHTDADQRQVKFEWILGRDVSAADGAAIGEAFERAGGEVLVRYPPKGFVPILIPIGIFGVIAAVALAEQIVDWWTNRSKSGLLIRPTADGGVHVEEIDIPYGHVIVVTADGQTITHTDVSANSIGELLKAAAKGLPSS